MKHRTFALAACLFAAALTTAAARAQTTDPPTAPLPARLATATKLFLGNAGDQDNADCLRAYNSFYAGLSKLGRFTLVADPAEADLVLEMHYEIALGQAIDTGSSRGVRQFRVIIVDPHTRVVLWSLTERTNYAMRQKNRNSNLDDTVAALVQDFNLLAAQQPVAPSNKSLVKH